MIWNRRNFLIAAGLGSAASTITANQTLAQPSQAEKEVALENLKDWDQVRDFFNLDPDYIHLAGLLIASNPANVQAAIESHRTGLDNNPTHYLSDHRRNLEAEVRQSAANYLGVQPDEIALTDSTTMGTGLVINGLAIRPDQEMLTTEFDYYSTHASLRYKADRTGAAVREIPLYQDIQNVSEDEMVETLVGAIRPNTRLVTATWVHSNTGLKVPIAQISERLKAVNANRDEEDRVLFFVDGVHGLGVEECDLSEIDCDFFVAGTHKWMFAPRGSGFIWGNPRSQKAVTPTIPTFSRGAGWGGWMTPGGFKPFEHQWAMVQAFAFHEQIGQKRVRKRLHRFSEQMKKGLAKMEHVTLYTPVDQDVSAAIVCFDVDGSSPQQVVDGLREQNIIASTTPYATSYARVSLGIYNTSEEIERTLRAIRELA
ncbi:Isopenicillin N epimerase [Acaryochloris thomasi RCC1774]|uniref:Isopenicillin N epimerase n=1 Tax=Acaryochloris thomasi RCC1774 TaxID=1764569 RepID=A0A2W1JK08_9CYAN|nr:aminotransferase class V-fold PLP-dependent enzyme [Acaryochloris thomasi]PZD73763.1 Isopenicillin N epimerase [Acaryochloris thomasi RCC1774]